MAQGVGGFFKSIGDFIAGWFALAAATPKVILIGEYLILILLIACVAWVVRSALRR